MTVKELQKSLNKILSENLLVDGIKGRHTNNALMQFQAKYGLIVSGEISNATINKIREILGNTVEEPTVVAPVKKLNVDLYSEDLGQTIINVAKQYVGLVEVKPNTKWDDLKTPEHDERAKKLVEWLKKAGHKDGWAYCQSLCEAIYRESLELHRNPQPATNQILTAITPSVMNTYEAFKKLGKITKTPEKGAIGFMRNGSSWTGHAFIVEMAKWGSVYTIEGNTSASGATVEADRNGDLIITKKRPLKFGKTSGLHLIGFVNPYK